MKTSQDISTEQASRIVYSSNPGQNEQYPDNTVTNTKYTLWNFLPKNIMEQFSRAMNRYFLFIACLQFISIITPVNPVSTLGPLIVIFGITALKELVDDRGRAAQDKIANERKYEVVRNGQLERIMSQDIHVGDIIRLSDQEEVPCDLCLLYSSSPNGVCFVQTTNLDGETNLKARQSPQETQALTIAEVEKFKGCIECSAPDHFVYKFDSRMWMEAVGDDSFDRSAAISLSSQQFLQQTITIKNVDFIYGVAVYTGNETKFCKNKDKPPFKWTRADKFINSISVLLFLFQLLLVAIFGAIGLVWQSENAPNHWYLRTSTSHVWYEYLIIPARFLLLNSTIIPISLKVTMDFCKLFYAKFIGWDVTLFEKDEQPAVANNSSISEDLGQIEYVLSDKTGTLTQNLMAFQKASVDGIIYTSHDIVNGDEVKSQSRDFRTILDDVDFKGDNFHNNGVYLVLNMLLNNGVQPTKRDDGSVVFRSASPDEEALVQACADVGAILISREGAVLETEIKGVRKSFTQLQELEFTSNRKRMSVVVRDQFSGRYFLFTKGADDVIYERLDRSQDTTKLKIHLDSFAQEGLRTLLYGYRILELNEFNDWLEIYQKANTELVDRELAVERACDVLEKNFSLIGATAIEDKLQVDVAETIGVSFFAF